MALSTFRPALHGGRLIPLIALIALGLSAGLAAGSAQASPATDVPCSIGSDLTLTVADSPHRVACDVTVAAGATLRIEAGALIQAGPNRTITVDGAVESEGRADAPVTIEAENPDAPWIGMVLTPSSGPHRFIHTRFRTNGGRATAMLEIHTSQVLVSESTFENTDGGAGIDVRSGSSPVIEDSRVIAADSPNLVPIGALRIFADSAPVLRNNFFQSNIIPVYMDMGSDPTFEGNRFDLNGINGVRLSGNVNGETTLRSLGPRRWPYVLDPSGTRINPGATLTIGPGVTLAVENVGFRVSGTLRILGEAGAKVLITTHSTNPAPGQWQEITFHPESTDYDEASGEGSIINQAIIEYGGSTDTGAINIQGSSPRIANTLIREAENRGLTVALDAAPTLAGVRVQGVNADADSVGLFVAGGEPVVGFSIFENNTNGVVVDGGTPVISPYNRFDRNLDFAFSNRNPTECVDATLNDWLDPAGPFDPSPVADACGLEANDNQAGGWVTDSVNYRPWIGQLHRPYLTGPLCGSHRQIGVIRGMAPAGSQVLIYDNYELLGETSAPEGDEALTEFVFQGPDLDPGSHTLMVRAETDTGSSGLSDPLDIMVDPGLLIDPSGMYVTYDLDGLRYAQGLNDLTGCASLQGGEWEIRVHPARNTPQIGADLTLHVPILCQAGNAAAQVNMDGQATPLTDDGNGLYEGQFSPGDGGPISLSVTCGDIERESSLGTVSLEYNGFIYDAGSTAADPTLDRVEGATVRLFQNLPGTGWVLWPGERYFGQSNPQITGSFGWYGFYPPPGQYRVEVRHASFDRYLSTPIDVTSEPIMLTIGLTGQRQIFLPRALNQ